MTMAQIFIPFVFLLILLILQELPNSGTVVPNPPVIPISNIPLCTAFAKDYCFTFVYSPKGAMTDKLVNRLAKANNLTVSTDASPKNSGDIIGFTTTKDMNQFILENQNTTQAAVAFGEVGGTYYSYSIYSNSTCTDNMLLPVGTQCPDVKSQLQIALDNSIAVEALHNDNVHIYASSKNFPVVSRINALSSDDVVRSYGSVFFFCGVMFNFVLFLYQIVSEKEKKLKIGMKQMGLKTITYWFSWFVTASMIQLLSVLVLIGSGWVMRFAFFVKGDLLVELIGFFLFGETMLIVAFFLNTFISTTKQAITVGMLVFVLGLLFQVMLSVPFFMTFVYSYYTISTYLRIPAIFCPPFNFAKIVVDISKLTYPTVSPTTHASIPAPGYPWSQLYLPSLYSDGTLVPCTLQTFYLLIMNMLFYGTLAFIFENLIEESRPIFFPFTREFWDIEMSDKEDPVSLIQSSNETTEEEEQEEEQEVREEVEKERVIVEDILKTESQLESIELYRVRREFKSLVRVLFGRGKGSHVKAVNDLSLHIQFGKLFCLLGHNGAGKTTTINILTGLDRQTSGYVSIRGYNVRYQMSTIRKVLGVCPQHDILFNELTGREHLELYCGLKRVPFSERSQQIDLLLSKVALTEKANKLVSSYSGGMKRRLSVAISCIGDPKIIIMDEPTTGMDPVNKRRVWNLIHELKRDRIILLTTHSMEEADILGDRIAVMAGGKLRCIGNPLYLKSRYGIGYRINLQCELDTIAETKELIEQKLPGARLLLETGLKLTYGVNYGDSELEQLIPFFHSLETDPSYSKLIKEWGLSHSTLEDVFLNITREFYQPTDTK